jgi:hypothetical protein
MKARIMREISESEAEERRLVVTGLRDLAKFIEANPHFPVGEVVMDVNLIARPDDMPDPSFASLFALCDTWERYEYDFQRHVTPSLARWVWEKRKGWRAFFGHGQVVARWSCQAEDF